jgi:HK97 gp10 family phage protein
MARKALRGATIRGSLSITDASWKKLRGQLKELEKAARKEIMEAAVLAGAEIVKDEANQHAPGPHIEVALDKVTDTNAIAKVGPDNEHWQYRFAELGATPHEITGAPLVFQGRAGLIVTGSVSHPGRAARPFLRPAMESKSREVQQTMADVIEEEMRKAV